MLAPKDGGRPPAALRRPLARRHRRHRRRLPRQRRAAGRRPLRRLLRPRRLHRPGPPLRHPGHGRQVGDPPDPGEARQRGLHAPRRQGRRGPRDPRRHGGGRGQGPGRRHLQGPAHRHRLGPPGPGDRARWPSSSPAEPMRSERGALVLSAAAAALLAAVGIAAAVATGSGAILLDGLFNLCFCVTALFTLRVARLLARPDDERYPFGYLFFEPLINTVKGLLILGVSAFALVDAGDRARLRRPRRRVRPRRPLRRLRHRRLPRRGAGAPPRRPEPARRRRRRHLDRQRRRSRAACSLGFLLAAWLERCGHAGAARLVDPAMVALVVLLSIAVPVRMAAPASSRSSTARPPPRSSPAWRRSPAAPSATCRSPALGPRDPARPHRLRRRARAGAARHRPRPRRPPTACAAR